MAELTEAQRRIVALTLLGEAAGEGEEGMAAVLWSMVNRSNSGRYPSDLAAVATQKNSKGVHQYSTWNKKSLGGNSPDTRFSTTSPEFKRALGVIDRVLSGTVKDPTGGATHFYAKGSAKPYWFEAEGPAGPVKIGNHYFAAKEAPSNSALSAINRVAPTVPPRRPDSTTQSSLLPPTRVRSVPINPQNGMPVNFPALRNSATRRDIGAIAPAPAPSPRPQSSAPAMFGDSSPAALSVTSRLGSRPDFSDSIAAPRYGDYDAARDLAARRYSTPPTVSRQPSQLAATTQMPPSVRPRTIAPTSTAPSPPALPGGGQQPISFAEATRRAALREREGAQIVGQGVPSLQQLTSGVPAEAPLPTIKRLVNVPNVGPAIIFNATAPDAGDPRRLNTQPLDIPPARSPAVPVGPSFPLRGGGALNGAPPNYGNYRAPLRIASGGQGGDVLRLPFDPMSETSGQNMANSSGRPVAGPSGKTYYPTNQATDRVRAPMSPVAERAQPQQRGGGLMALLSGLMGGGQSGNGGGLGAMLGGGGPSSFGSSPSQGLAMTVNPGTSVGQTLSGMGFSDGAAVPAATIRNLEQRGYF